MMMLSIHNSYFLVRTVNQSCVLTHLVVCVNNDNKELWLGLESYCVVWDGVFISYFNIYSNDSNKYKLC